jgi:hypothetical protein
VLLHKYVVYLYTTTDPRNLSSRKPLSVAMEMQEELRLSLLSTAKYFGLLLTTYTSLRLHVKCPIFLFDFKQIWSFSTDFLKICILKFHENLFSESYADICGQTNRHRDGLTDIRKLKCVCSYLWEGILNFLRQRQNSMCCELLILQVFPYS